MANSFLGETTVIAGGQNWTLRCDFNAMADFEEATGKDALEAFGRVEEGDFSVIDLRHMVHAFLKRHHPDATLQDAGDVVSHDVECVTRLITEASPDEDEVEDGGNGQAAAGAA